MQSKFCDRCKFHSHKILPLSLSLNFPSPPLPLSLFLIHTPISLSLLMTHTRYFLLHVSSSYHNTQDEKYKHRTSRMATQWLPLIGTINCSTTFEFYFNFLPWFCRLRNESGLTKAQSNVLFLFEKHWYLVGQNKISNLEEVHVPAQRKIEINAGVQLRVKFFQSGESASAIRMSTRKPGKIFIFSIKNSNS